MHQPKFHPEVLSYRSADLLSVSGWLSEAVMLVVCAGCSINTGVSGPGIWGLVLVRGQGVVCCLWGSPGSPGQAAQSPELLLVLAELALPLCSLGMGSARLVYPCCNVMSSPSVRLLLCPVQDSVVPPAVLPGAAHHSSCLECRNFSSSGMYFSALLLHHLQITADLCLQVLSHKHSAAAGVLGGNWIALSDISLLA